MSINLRQKFNDILDYDKEFNWMIIRHKTQQKCSCWRRLSDSPDPLCPNCEGLGWIFTEWLEKCKSFNTTTFRPVAHLSDFNIGQTYHQHFVVYLKANERNQSINIGDQLFDIACMVDGRIINPIKRIRKWKIVDKLDMQLDNNRLEFIKLFANPLVA